MWQLNLFVICVLAAPLFAAPVAANDDENAKRSATHQKSITRDSLFVDSDYVIASAAQQPPTIDEGLDPNGLFPPPRTEIPNRVSPPLVAHAYDRVSENAFDAVGSYQDPESLGPDRPAYPYGAAEDWYGHAADVEEWGDLLELPYVRLGWFANAEVSLLKARTAPRFNSGPLLDASFPGDPVTLETSDLDWTAAPRLEFGYRFEHGLGDIRSAYRYIGTQGNEPVAGFDAGSNGVIGSKINLHVLDVDLSYLEYNPEGVPLPFPLFLVPGRLGLGRPIHKGILLPPMEYRRYFGMRVASFYYNSVATGDLKTEIVTNNFNGAGLHFGTELNQQIAFEQPYFMHLKMEGSGMFGVLHQSFTRTQVVSQSNGVFGDGMGIPTLAIEFGFSWAPSWPERNTRFTAAYALEEWFSFADTDFSNAHLIMDAFVFRFEHKY